MEIEEETNVERVAVWEAIRTDWIITLDMRRSYNDESGRKRAMDRGRFFSHK